MMKVPSASRLDTAARVARKMMEPSFRQSLPRSDSGERRIVTAESEDLLKDVFGRIDGIGMPITICVPVGATGVLPITVCESDEREPSGVQECSPESDLGMLIELLAHTREAVTVCLREPLQLAFA